MKNLEINYKKIYLQKLTCKIVFINFKLAYYFIYYNQIGFTQEYYYPEEKNYKNNFSNCTHTSLGNEKLFKKYPNWFKNISS